MALLLGRHYEFPQCRMIKGKFIIYYSLLSLATVRKTVNSIIRAAV
jgi:hypothetical protein